jgi:hypothetical protein
MEKEQYVESFVHSQLAIERILWGKIVGLFNGGKAVNVRKTIDDWTRKHARTATTFELIKWAHFLGAIDRDDFSNLNDFNKKRNDLLHGHGEWWTAQHTTSEYKEALEKGIRFLENNNFQ